MNFFNSISTCLRATITVLTFSLVLAKPLLAGPQHQVIDMQLTPLGDADMTIKIKFDAQAWQTWKQTIGENPSVMKRELERMFSSVVLSDFKFERNDLEREATLRVHAVGLARYRGNGEWETDLDDEAVEGATISKRKINDTTFLVTNTQSVPGAGVVMQQEITLSLPEGASGLMEGTSELGSGVLRYNLEPATGQTAMPWILSIVGVGCLLASIVSFSFAAFSRKSKPRGNAGMRFGTPPALEPVTSEEMTETEAQAYPNPLS